MLNFGVPTDNWRIQCQRSGGNNAVWHIFGDSRLSKTAKNFIETAGQNGNQIGISAITLVELVYLIEKGRIAAESFTRLASTLDDSAAIFVEIPVDLSIARALSRVIGAQIPDMPDRIIAATALALNVPIISRDAKIQQSTLQTIW